MKAATFLLLIAAAYAQTLQKFTEKYTRLTYSEMRLKLYELQDTYEHKKVIEIKTAEEMLGIAHYAECEKGKLCQLDIVTLTDFDTSSEEKV